MSKYKPNDPVVILTPHGFQVGIALEQKEVRESPVYKVRLPNMQPTWYPEKSLNPYFPKCPVCKREMSLTSDNRIEEHHHNSKVCYGSYTPYELRTP